MEINKYAVCLNCGAKLPAYTILRETNSILRKKMAIIKRLVTKWHYSSVEEAQQDILSVIDRKD